MQIGLYNFLMATRRLLALVGATLVVSSIYISASTAADRPVAESNFITPIQNGDGTVYKLTVTFNAYVATCQSLNRIGFKVDNESASYDSSFMRTPKIKTGVFTEDFEIRTDTWTEGSHTITPVAYDSCYTAYSDSSRVTSVSITVPKFITTTITSPSKNAIANKPFDVTIQVTGVQAKTISAAALDMSGGAWIKPPTFMGIDKRKDDPTAAYTFASAHQHAVAFWLSPATTFTWKVDPTGWNTGTRNLQVTILDLAGRQYQANTSVIVPEPTKTALRISNQLPDGTGTLTGVATLEVVASIFPNSGYTVKKIWMEVTDLPIGNVDGLKMPIIKANFPTTVESGSNLLTWVPSDGSTSSTFSFQVDTSSWKNGTHVFKAWLMDSAGTTAVSNQITASTSNNPPSVGILETPQKDLLQSQSLKLNAKTGAFGSARLVFISILVNGKALNSFPGVKPNFVSTTTSADYSLPSSSTYEPSWTIDASEWAEGDYTLKVSTTDTNGRISPVVSKDFYLYNSKIQAENAKIQAEKRSVYDQILEEINRSGDGYNDRYTKIQDTIQSVKDKADDSLTLIKSVSISAIGTTNFENTISARTKRIQIQENSTTKDKGYKYLQPFATNCAQADVTSKQLAVDLSSISDRILDLNSRNQNINSLISQLAAIKSDLSQNVKALPDLPFPVNAPNDWAKLTVPQLTSALIEIKAANAELSSIQKKATDQKITSSFVNEIGNKLDQAKSAMSDARAIEAELNASLASDTAFKALLTKEANYLQGCMSKQKVKVKGSSQPAIKVAAPTGKIVTINCTNGIKTTKVTGTAPTCPAGYRKS